MLAIAQRGADVDHDGQVHAHFAGHIHRNVVDHAAVHQQTAVQFDRGEHGGDRHAGADHLGQVTTAEYDFFATGDVGGHCAEGDGQLIEVAGVGGMRQFAFQ
ncbi:hypothetical protein D3C72_2026570 [compost metagenome]